MPATPPGTLSKRSAGRLGLKVPLRALIAFAVAFVAGLVPTTMWADENSGNEDAATIGLAWLTFVSFIVFTIACLVIAYRHKRQHGLGMGSWLVLGLWVFAGFLGALLVEPYAQRGGYGLMPLYIGLLVAAGTYMTWILLAGKQRRAAGTVALATIGMVVGGALIGIANEASHETQRLRRIGAPLALVEPERLHDALAGWTIERLDQRVPTIDLRSENGVRVDIRLWPHSVTCDDRFNTCTPLEPLSDGSAVELEVMDHGCDGAVQGDRLETHAARPEGTWTVSVRRESCGDQSMYPTVNELVSVLEVLEPATPGEWISAALSQT